MTSHESKEVMMKTAPLPIVGRIDITMVDTKGSILAIASFKPEGLPGVQGAWMFSRFERPEDP